MEEKNKTMATYRGSVVTGVIGADVHAVGNRLLSCAWSGRGFKVLNLADHGLSEGVSSTPPLRPRPTLSSSRRSTATQSLISRAYARNASSPV